MTQARSGFRMLVGVLALAAGPAVAGETARTMDALDGRLKPGTEIDVTDREGRVFRGQFVRADDDGVLLTAFGGDQGRRIAAADVVSVSRHGDSLKNGALVGAAAGGITALAISIEDNSGYSEPICTDTGCKVIASVFAVVTYAGIGMLVDRAIKGREVVYRAPSRSTPVALSVVPYPVRCGAGVRLALKF